MKKNIFSCAFTGHRPRSFPFGYDESSVLFSDLKNRIKNTVIQLCNAGCRVFYCGMAEGADLWCAEVVLELQNQFDPPLEIRPVIPYLSQPASMTKRNQERYRKIMDSSAAKFLVSRNFTKSCFQKRNYYMVDSADALIAIFDDKNSFSGTAQTIRYAKRKEKEIFLIPIIKK